MTPYMRAYEAGVKLAQSEYFGKYANPSETFEDGYEFTDEDIRQFNRDQGYQSEGDPEFIEAGNANTDIVSPATQSRPRTRESASELLARVNAMPRKVYDNVVGPTYNTSSAPTVNYQAPSGRGDLGGYEFGSSPQLQGGQAGLAARRSTADMDTRLQGLRSSLSRGGSGQGARMRQLGNVMDILNRPTVNLTTPAGGMLSMDRGDISRQVSALGGRAQPTRIPFEPKGSPSAVRPNIPSSGGLMDSVRSSNRRLSTPVPDGVPSFRATPQSRANTNPATGRQFSAATSPSNFKMPEYKLTSSRFDV